MIARSQKENKPGKNPPSVGHGAAGMWQRSVARRSGMQVWTGRRETPLHLRGGAPGESLALLVIWCCFVFALYLCTISNLSRYHLFMRLYVLARGASRRLQLKPTWLLAALTVYQVPSLLQGGSWYFSDSLWEVSQVYHCLTQDANSFQACYK